MQTRKQKAEFFQELREKLKPEYAKLLEFEETKDSWLDDVGFADGESRDSVEIPAFMSKTGETTFVCFR